MADPCVHQRQFEPARGRGQERLWVDGWWKDEVEDEAEDEDEDEDEIEDREFCAILLRC